MVHSKGIPMPLGDWNRHHPSEASHHHHHHHHHHPAVRDLGVGPPHGLHHDFHPGNPLNMAAGLPAHSHPQVLHHHASTLDSLCYGAPPPNYLTHHLAEVPHPPPPPPPPPPQQQAQQPPPQHQQQQPPPPPQQQQQHQQPNHQHPPQQQIPVSSGGEENPPPPSVTVVPLVTEVKKQKKKRKSSFSVGQIVDTGVATDNKCPQCFKLFNTKGLLTQHLLVHTNVRRFPCDFCEKAFKQKAHLETHKRIHTGDKPYKCQLPNCEKSFAQMTNLKTHMKHHENQLERKLAIEGGLPAPKKEFPDDDRIDVVEDVKPVDGRKRGRPRKPKDEHIHWRGRGRPRNDGNDANLQDPYYSACAGVAGERVTLQLLGPGARADNSSEPPNAPPARQPAPKREKKSNASFDGNGYAAHDFNDSNRDHPQQQPQRNRKSDKAEARKSTTTGGDVTCEVCYKIFRTKGLLTQHMLVHNNIRRFVCDVCEKAFKQKAHLKTHSRLHTGEKPYSCTMPNCERQFAQATNLKLHLRSHENRLDRVVLSVEPAGGTAATEEAADDKAGYQHLLHNVEGNLDKNQVKTDLDDEEQKREQHLISSGFPAQPTRNLDEEEQKRKQHLLPTGFSTHSSPPPTSVSEHQHPHPQHSHLHHNPHMDKLVPHQIQQQHLQPQHHSHPQHSSPPGMATSDNGGHGGLWSPRDHQVIAGMVPVHDHLRDRIMTPQLNDDKGH